MTLLTAENLMYLQLALEGLLVFLLLVLLIRSRRKDKEDPARMPNNLKESIERFLSESEKISQSFAQNLKDKKDLSASLILKLDRRLADYRTLLKQVEESFIEAQKKAHEQVPAPITFAAEIDRANPAAPEVRTMVLQLAKKGLTIEEIAQKARLHRGEVELIIDLEKQFSV